MASQTGPYKASGTVEQRCKVNQKRLMLSQCASTVDQEASATIEPTEDQTRSLKAEEQADCRRCGQSSCGRLQDALNSLRDGHSGKSAAELYRHRIEARTENRC